MTSSQPTRPGKPTQMSPIHATDPPAEADDLPQAERAALDFADRFATDHLGIDDAVYDELREHFSEDELVQLGVQCAMFVGIGRIAATWNVVEDLPDELRKGTTGSVTPWMIPGE